MTPELAAFLATLIPRVTQYVRDQLAEGKTMPTDEEVHAALTTDEDSVLAISNDWLSSHNA